MNLDPVAIAAALSPAEKLAAARDLTTSDWGGWTVWLPVLGGVAMAALLVALWRRHETHRKVVKALYRAAERLHLGANERAVLARIAEGAEAKRLDDVRTPAVAFEEGVAALMRGESVAGLNDEGRQRVAEIVASLRAKLGFELTAAGSAAASLVADDRIALVRRGTPGEVAATVARVVDRDVVLQLEEPAPLRVGESCTLRRVRDNLCWEYQAMAVEAGQALVLAVRLIGAPKPTNLRRFVRVRTRKAARLAPFPFVDDRPADEVPQFVAGTLTEMGGPGLRIEAPIELSKGSRVLLMLELDGTHSLRATGLVRRSSLRDDGVAEVGVEIVGLNDEQMADLVKATHAAAQAAGIDLTLATETGEVPAEAAQGRMS